MKISFRSIPELVLACTLALPLVACSGSGSSSPTAINLAGSWTVTAVSTKGQGNFSGTATVTQTGVGLGINGATTFAASIGNIAVSQSGTALTGTLTNSIQHSAFSFIGTLSGGNFTITGSIPCSATSIVGTVTSSSMQGTYTITRGSGCYYSSDAGTFVATKQ